MIVDDSATSRLLLDNILRKSGYAELLQASSAAEALNMLHADPGVDLVLMDLNMPGMDGIEATRHIKSDPVLRDIPIIMVTVSDDNESLELAFEAGAIDYINKPLCKVELRARVRSVLRLKQETDQRKERERELQELTRQLEELSNLDGLTGVPNRRRFDEVFHKEWLRCRRDKAPVSLLMIDIDFFKAYNDTYGHLQGDTCLKHVAAAIQEALRRPGDMVARFGGEEFSVVLPLTDAYGAFSRAEQIVENVRRLDLRHEASLVSPRVTVSVGIATMVPDAEDETHNLLQKADEALYRAKKEGRDKIVVADA